jgi:opacity protein-like surface antigen
MHKATRDISRYTVAAFAALILVVLANSARVDASGIPLSVVGPHEYALPVNYESFNAVAQYAFVQTDNMAFDSTGKRVAGPGTFTAVGFTKYVRFFTFKSLPDVGFAWEVLEPEISVQGPGVSVTGFGDPLTGLAVWMKPSKNSTLGVQSFLSIPAGSDAVSDKTWGSLTTIVGDVQLGNLDIDGQTGVIFKSTRHLTGADDVNPGATFHANLRAGYRVHEYLEPFLAADYQTTGTSTNDVTGRDIPVSASSELTLGGGLMVHFTNPMSLTVRYDYGVDGKNTPVTSALYLKIAYIW